MEGEDVPHPDVLPNVNGFHGADHKFSSNAYAVILSEVISTGMMVYRGIPAQLLVCRPGTRVRMGLLEYVVLKQV